MVVDYARPKREEHFRKGVTRYLSGLISEGDYRQALETSQRAFLKLGEGDAEFRISMKRRIDELRDHLYKR